MLVLESYFVNGKMTTGRRRAVRKQTYFGLTSSSRRIRWFRVVGHQPQPDYPPLLHTQQPQTQYNSVFTWFVALPRKARQAHGGVRPTEPQASQNRAVRHICGFTEYLTDYDLNVSVRMGVYLYPVNMMDIHDWSAGALGRGAHVIQNRADNLPRQVTYV